MNGDKLEYRSFAETFIGPIVVNLMLQLVLLGMVEDTPMETIFSRAANVSIARKESSGI